MQHRKSQKKKNFKKTEGWSGSGDMIWALDVNQKSHAISSKVSKVIELMTMS